MNRYYFAALALLIAGCARTKAPVVAVAPTATPIPTLTATPIFVPTPAIPAQATPMPDAETTQRRAVVLRELARLQTASPDQDFAAAWASKNTKFIALRGVGWHIPGVPEKREFALLDKYDAIPIEGMTDVMNFQNKAS